MEATEDGSPDRRIVVGVDGSSGASQACRWAAALAPTLGADVVAVHAVGMLEEAHERGTTVAERRAELHDIARRDWCAGLRAAGCDHHVELVDGPPVDVLLRTAEALGAQLLVVGSRGVGAEPARALGSTSLKVLQAARLPVLVVPDAPAGGGEPRPVGLARVLVGVDRSAGSLAALALAADLAEIARAAVTVLEVVEMVPPFPLGPSTTVTSAGEEGAIDRTATLLEDAARGIRARGVDVAVVVRSGEPGPTLLELADSIDADLVVVGTRGRGGPDELLLGSVARTVADRARRPTLVVPDTAAPVRLTSGG